MVPSARNVEITARPCSFAPSWAASARVVMFVPLVPCQRLRWASSGPSGRSEDLRVWGPRSSAVPRRRSRGAPDPHQRSGPRKHSGRSPVGLDRVPVSHFRQGYARLGAAGVNDWLTDRIGMLLVTASGHSPQIWLERYCNQHSLVLTFGRVLGIGSQLRLASAPHAGRADPRCGP